MIKFGTSGWRAILADEFTYPNVRLVTQAIANYLKRKNKPGEILIGYDNRFLSDTFAKHSATILHRNKFKPVLSKRSIATPVLSVECLRRKANGIINFTASHNPFEYNGLKFSPASAGPALPEDTQAIEKEIHNLFESNFIQKNKNFSLEESLKPVDLERHYLKRLNHFLDTKALKKSKIKVIYSPLYGAGIGILDNFLKNLGLKVCSIENHIDPYFGYKHPEPSLENMLEIKRRILQKEFNIGLATDGDADRFGIIDSNGMFIEPNFFIALLADYLIEQKGFKGGLARSLATSHLLDRVAKYHAREIHETPVGFKYIGELISKNKIAIGGEESAGLSIRGHIPEKDGILACILAAEMVAIRKKSLSEQLKDLFKKTGRLFSKRVNLRVAEKIKKQLLKKLQQPDKLVKEKKVIKIDRRDGVKFHFEIDNWVLIRLSGTEPLVRVYAEAPTKKLLQENLSWGEKIIFG
ncbi:phosphoglucomutase/phosphomannomutase family protein [Candidatus Riflebacteria bacterium]